jgi:hypothetical protein
MQMPSQTAAFAGVARRKLGVAGCGRKPNTPLDLVSSMFPSLFLH